MGSAGVLGALQPLLKRWPEGGLKVSAGAPQVTQDSSLTWVIFPSLSLCWLSWVAVLLWLVPPELLPHQVRTALAAVIFPGNNCTYPIRHSAATG